MIHMTLRLVAIIIFFGLKNFFFLLLLILLPFSSIHVLREQKYLPIFQHLYTNDQLLPGVIQIGIQKNKGLIFQVLTVLGMVSFTQLIRRKARLRVIPSMDSVRFQERFIPELLFLLLFKISF